VTEVAPGVFVHRGAHEEATPRNLGGYANIGFVVGRDAVAVIDSGGSAAQGKALREAIRQVTPLPIAYVIITHGHPDHMLGTAAFEAEKPKILGHAKLPAAMAARGPFYLEHLKQVLGGLVADTRILPPGETVAESLSLDLGERRLRLTAYPTAHTDNDLTVLDEATGTLWAGDLVFMERLPVVDGSLKGWLRVLESLRQVEAVRVVPGHGPASAPWPDALAAQQRYLESLLTETRAIIAEGGRIEEAVERVGRSARPDWELFEDNHPRNIVTVFTELEWE
jgi:quinoprotein relay system zinc metallohydrolase 2